MTKDELLYDVFWRVYDGNSGMLSDAMAQTKLIVAFLQSGQPISHDKIKKAIKDSVLGDMAKSD